MKAALSTPGGLPPQHGRRAARGSAPSRRAAVRRWAGDSGVAALVMLGLLAAVLVLGLIGAVFSSTTSGPASSLTAGSLDGYVPTAVTATRTTSTTCSVSWTPAGGLPSGLQYDVTDGTSTLTSNVSGTSVTVTVPTTSVTPRVKARLNSWVSSASTAASAACKGFPDAPGSLTLTPSDGAVAASWSAPAGNGGTVASYTATISPAPGSGSATCTVTAPTTACSWSSLTNGLTYTVSVTATSEVGTGPAATGTAIPYPSTVMTSGAVKLWLDGADASTMFAASTCTGATATTTVGCWKDKSTSANNATQSTGAAQPVLATVGSRPVPSFDGSASYLGLSAAALPNGTSPSSTFLVARNTTPVLTAADWQTALSWGSTVQYQTRSYQKAAFGSSVGVSTYQGVLASAGTMTTGMTGILSDAWSSTQYNGWWNGAAGTTVSATTSTGTTTAYVGAQVWTGHFWQGQVPEAIVLSGTVTSAQRRTVEEYLARKWSTTITPAAPTGVNGSATSASSTSAVVAWTAPTYDGGSAVTSYTATAVPTAGGSTVTCTATAPATTCTLTGLAGGGAQYSVTVAATNAVGAGPSSSAATVFSGIPSGASAKLWLAADDLDGDGPQTGSSESGLVSGTVQTWKDKSGGGLDVTAPSASERPTYASTTLGGYAVPTFNGSTVLSGGGTNPYGITGDRSLFVVTRGRTFDSTGTYLDGKGTYLVDRSNASNGLFGVKVCSGNWAVQHRDDTQSSGGAAVCTSGGSSPLAGRVDLVEGFRSGTAVQAYVSGSPGSTATNPGTITQNPVTIGRAVSATTDHDIAEVLLYSTALSGSQRRAVETYLAAKWGVSLAPDAPTGVTATPTGTSGQASVSWTAPTDIGGSALTLYTAKTTSGGFSCTATPPATTCTLPGLTDGTTYTVYVEAKNSTGTGARSSTTTVVPGTAPGAPTGVSATSGDTTSSVSWTAPASTGGYAITSYTATAVPSDGTLPNVTCTSATSPCSLTGLVNGITYSVTVSATNAVGTSAASSAAPSNPYPATLLSAATLWLDASSPAYLFSDTGCTTAAGTSAGSAVSCWKDRSTSARNATAVAAAAVGTTLGGRTTLAFSGTSQLSTTRPTANDMTLFAVPRTSATVGTTSSQWYSGAPLLDGSGTNVQSDYGFTLTGGRIALGTGNPDTTARGTAALNDAAGHVVVGRRSAGSLEASSDGRTRGTATSSNTAALTASNAFYLGKNISGAAFVGDLGELLVLPSALSRTDERTVLEYLARKWGVAITAQAPTAVTATGGQNGQAPVSWTAPAWNGGASVTSYTVTSSPGSLTCTTASTSCTVTGLTNGTAYTFTVTATNSVGTGSSSSASSSVTPVGPPGAPTGVGATTGDTTSSVSWTAPASTGGSAITSYTATAVPSAGSGYASLPNVTCTSASSPCTLTGLVNGVTYSVTVAAANVAGSGSASSATTVLPYPSGVLTSGRVQLWLDGADGSRMFAGSTCSGTLATTTVGCWLDRSSNATSVNQGTASKRPTLTTVASRSVPGFDGTDDEMTADISVLPTGTASSTTFAVATMTDPSPSTSVMRTVFGWGWVSSGAARGIFKQANSSAVMSSSWTNNTVTDGVWSSSPQLAVAEHASPYVTLWTAGRPATVSSNQSFSTSTIGATLAHANNGYHWYGAVPELMILNTTLTGTERRQVEEYLARKWSVTVTPSAPVSVSATPGAAGTATVSWSAPAWDGGASVSSYTVTTSGGGSCTVGGTSATCTGVTAGSRTFTVTATSSVGTGPSATATATVS